MPTRTISTRLAVEGESQYKAAISSVNAELRNMQSALKMTESQYKNNANSIEALTAMLMYGKVSQENYVELTAASAIPNKEIKSPQILRY